MNEFIKHYWISDFIESLCWLTHTRKNVPEEIPFKYSKHLERHPLLRDSWRQRNVGRSTQGYYPKRGRSGTPPPLPPWASCAESIRYFRLTHFPFPFPNLWLETLISSRTDTSCCLRSHFHCWERFGPSNHFPFIKRKPKIRVLLSRLRLC